jgi:peptidoglycan/LPS O-acetylase OafA/YrhL
MTETPRIHLPGLNGIRAIAALAVIFSHIGLSLHMFGLNSLPDIDLAGYGVTIFFALSGFLITYLLLIEKERFERVNIRQFYMRRILRIWPLYYLYIALTLLVLFIYKEEFPDFRFLLFTIFFSANIPMIIAVPMGLLGHFWSLGVEEQFYLFWPWIVDRTKKLFKWILWFVVIFFILKLLAWAWFKRSGELIPYSIFQVTRFHCMAIGAAAAILYYNRQQQFLKISYTLVSQIICWAIIALLAFSLLPLPSVIKHELVALASVVLIVNVAGNEKAIIKLRGRLPDFLGKISFGLYVYHPLVIYLVAKWMGSGLAVFNVTMQHIIIYALVPLATILVAACSYELYEKKFLKLKTRFSPVLSQAAER